MGKNKKPLLPPKEKTWTSHNYMLSFLIGWINFYFQNCLSPFLVWANGRGTNYGTEWSPNMLAYHCLYPAKIRLVGSNRFLCGKFSPFSKKKVGKIICCYKLLIFRKKIGQKMWKKEILARICHNWIQHESQQNNFLLSCFEYHQIWLNAFIDVRHLTNLTKLKKNHWLHKYCCFSILWYTSSSQHPKQNWVW